MRTAGRTAGRLTLGIALLVLLGVPSRADAQNASALVLEKTGATVPEVQPYNEIAVGTTVSLQPGARLVFLHYQTCRTVTAVGGTGEDRPLRGGARVRIGARIAANRGLRAAVRAHRQVAVLLVEERVEALVV